MPFAAVAKLDAEAKKLYGAGHLLSQRGVSAMPLHGQEKCNVEFRPEARGGTEDLCGKMHATIPIAEPDRASDCVQAM